MKILFLHPNFPAQFKSPCIRLGKEKHQIKFICQTHYGRCLDNVEKLVLKGKGSHDNTLLSGKDEVSKTLYRANAYRESFQILKKQGWSPDVTIAHSGWGCGMYVKETWPTTHLISYLEWWFDISSDFVTSLNASEYFNNFSEGDLQKLWNRNAYAAIEMCSANKIITPTQWQKDQLPELLANNCQIIPDEVNKNLFFSEPEKRSKTPVITYGTRGMEPMRGFPQFIKLLPQLMKKWPQLRVEIAGEDSISYGGKLPKEKTWKRWALKALEKEGITDRITWLGRMPLKHYSRWLKKTWCHIYLSEPFVTSWSYIEAMHCQIPMIASNTKAGLEFKHLNRNCTFVDHNNHAEMLAEVNNKIRFLPNSTRNKYAANNDMQPEMQRFDDFGQASLARLIADVEATTRV